MGKDKNAPRTKGNQKPSSSGRSAELLGKQGNNTRTFQGFGNSSAAHGSYAATDELNDSHLENNLKLAFRKMAKKDSTTKIKALQEYEALISSEDAASLISGLPYWTRLFRKLSIDFDKRVREQSLHCQGKVSKKVGRQIAPYLHDVMPYWIIAMNDPYSAVSTAASTGFQEVFSETKRPEVLLHSCKSIVSVITHNLFNETPDSLSDVKSSTAEEREEKYVRVLCCSLKSFSMLHNYIKHKDTYSETAVPLFAKLLQDELFWKMHKHQNSKVRSSFYECVSCVIDCNVCSVSSTAQAVRTGLSDQEASVLPYAMSALLHLAASHPGSWEHLGCSSPKPVTDKLIKLLQDGCRGVAENIVPHLLPLLSLMPETSLANPEDFYCKLLRALTDYILLNKFQCSRQQATAVLESLFECIRYLSKHRAIEPDFWNKVFDDQLIPLLSLSFQDPRHFNSGLVHEKIISLSQFWTKLQMCASQIEKESKNPSSNSPEFFKNLVLNFWKAAFGEMSAALENGNAVKLRQIFNFVHMIKHPDSHSKSKKSGVKFITSEPKFNQKITDESDFIEKVESDATADLFKLQFSDMFECVVNVTQACYEQYKARDNVRLELFRVYSELLSTFASVNNVTRSTLLDVIIPELQHSNSELQELVSEVFLRYLFELPDAEQMELLDVVLYSSGMEGLRCLLQRASSYVTHSESIKRWLQSAPLGARLVTLVKEALAVTASLASHDLLEEEELSQAIIETQLRRRQLVALVKIILSQCNENGFQFNINYISQILVILHTSLPTRLLPVSNTCSTSQRCVTELILELSSVFFKSNLCWQLPHSYNLLQSLFILTCPSDVLLQEEMIESDNNDDPPDVLCESILPHEVTLEVRSVVMRALGSLVSSLSSEKGDKEASAQYNDCLCKMFSHVKAIIEDEHCKLIVADYLASLVVECLLIAAEEIMPDDSGDIPLDHQRVRDALDILVPSEGFIAGAELQMSSMYTIPYFTLGFYNFRSAPSVEDIQRGQMSVVELQYTRVAMFLSSVLLGLCNPSSVAHPTVTDKDSTHGNIDNDLLLAEGRLKSLKMPSYLTESMRPEDQVSLGPYTRLVCLCFHASEYHNLTSKFKQALSDGCTGVTDTVTDDLCSNTRHLMDRLNLGNLQQIMNVIRDKAAEDSTGNWCITLARVLSMKSSVINIKKLYSSINSNSYNAAVVKQLLIPYMSKEDASELFSDELSCLLALKEDPFAGVDVLGVLGTLLNYFTFDNVELSIQDILDVTVQWLEEGDGVFFDDDESKFEDTRVVSCIMRILNVLFEQYSEHFTDKHWDRVLCALVQWMQNLRETSITADVKPALAVMLCAIGRCAASLTKLMQKMITLETASRSKYPANLTDEWKDFFSSSIHECLLNVFFKVSELYSLQHNRSMLLYAIARSVSEYVGTLSNSTEIIDVPLPPLLHKIDSGKPLSLPNNLQVLLNYTCASLISPHPSIACSSYRLLCTCLRDIMSAWCKSGSSITQEASSGKEASAVDSKKKLEMPYVLMRQLYDCDVVVSTALSEKPPLQGYCVVVPHTDSYSYTLGYLLSWSVVCAALTELNEEDRRLYAEHLNSPTYISSLLTQLMKLLPPQFSFPSYSSLEGQSMLQTPFDLQPTECGNSYSVWWLACHVYLQCLKLFPSWVRRWYTQKNKHNADIINNYTTAHFSPVYISEELNALKNFSDDVVSVRVVSQKEVTASYTIDDSPLPLTLTIPPNLPLCAAEIQTCEQYSVNKKLWDTWKNTLKTSLDLRNSSLMTSLRTWKNNLDQKYSGVEPCYICYCVVHINYKSLPASQCRTCRKKFHSQCMYTWFMTSTKSECPLCRSVW